VDIRHVGIGSHVGTETQIDTNIKLFRIQFRPFDITSWLWKLSPPRHTSALASGLSAPWNNQPKATTQLPYRGMVTWLDGFHNGKFHHNAGFLRGIIFGHGEMPTDMQRLTLALYISPQSGSSLYARHHGAGGPGAVTRCAIL
jgi:hypothetical protein